MDGTARARDGALYRIRATGTPLQERVMDSILWDIRRGGLRHGTPEQTARDVARMYGITDYEISVIECKFQLSNGSGTDLMVRAARPW